MFHILFDWIFFTTACNIQLKYILLKSSLAIEKFYIGKNYISRVLQDTVRREIFIPDLISPLLPSVSRQI